LKQLEELEKTGDYQGVPPLISNKEAISAEK